MTTALPVGVLAAAGAGSRFGGQKLLAPLAGGTPLAVAAATALGAALPRVVAVVPPDAPELAAVLGRLGVELVVNPRPERGLGSSIAAGVWATRCATGWVIALADMPFIRPATVSAVAGTLVQGAAIAVPVQGGRRGHPVAFAGALGPRLWDLDGDVGARGLLDAESERVVPVVVDDPGIHRDVDRPGDLAAHPGWSA